MRHHQYRRRVFYAGRVVPLPHLIPEVVDPAVVAEADRLMARPPSEKSTAQHRHAFAQSARDGGTQPGGPRTTYATLLRCGGCGRTLGLSTGKKRRGPRPDGPARLVFWFCDQGAAGGAPSRTDPATQASPQCRSSAGVAAARLDPLIGLRRCGCAARGAAWPRPRRT